MRVLPNIHRNNSIRGGKNRAFKSYQPHEKFLFPEILIKKSRSLPILGKIIAYDNGALKTGVLRNDLNTLKSVIILWCYFSKCYQIKIRACLRKKKSQI